MGQTAVFIGTTIGPNRVMRILAADHYRVSSVGIRIKTKQAQISQSYHEFVSYDSGVIARHTQTDRYRLDLADEIDEGNSWNLGVFVAHKLAYLDSLATIVEGDPINIVDADNIVWATGEVDSDHKVHRVPDIVRKLVMSDTLFKTAAAQDCPVVIMLPAAAMSDEVQSHLNQLTRAYPNLSVHPLTDIQFNDGVEENAQPAHSSIKSDSDLARSRSWWSLAMLWGVGVVPLMLIVWLAVTPGTESPRSNDPATLPSNSAPTAPASELAPQVVVTWLESPDDHCFRELTAGGSVALLWSGPQTIQSATRVCRLQFSIDATGDQQGEFRVGVGGIELAFVSYGAGQRTVFEVGVYRFNSSQVELTARYADTSITQVVNLP